MNQKNQNNKTEVLKIIENAKSIILSIPTLYDFKTDANKKGKVYYYRQPSRLEYSIKVLNNLKEEVEASEDIDQTILNYFFIKIGNIKLDDLVYSVGPSHLCTSFLNKNCANCGICYGFKDERQNNALKARIKNYIFIEYVIKTNNYELIKKAVQEIKPNELINSYNSKAETETDKITLENVKALRLNESGDLENKHEKYIKVLVNELKNIFDLKKVYSYTHNPNLNKELFKNVNINKSLNCTETINYLESVKNLDHNIYCNCTIEEVEYLKQYLKTKGIKFYICCSNCKKCNYCKINLKGVIITINH